MKNKKGFTLIELLTVIAILAIILLIAAPTILGVLDKAKKNTFKNQVLLYVESLKQQVALTALNQADMNITLPDEGESTLVSIQDIPMDTNTSLKGNIKIVNDNGSYKYILVGVNDDNYKVNNEVEAKSLGINDIVKNDGTSSTPPTPTYTAYNIGQQVTLKDNSTWYVIENSDSSSSTVTLFASSNIKNDASGFTTVMDEYKIAFDEANARLTENNSYCISPINGCNMYASNGSTVTEDSTIKKFIDNQVLPYINNSLKANGGTSINSIRLITLQEICNIINATDTSNNCIPITTGSINFKDTYISVPEWLYSINYWTMTLNSSNVNYVYHVDTNFYLNNVAHANNDVKFGARPVIITNKSNIK